jgi:hypothetical protein
MGNQYPKSIKEAVGLLSSELSEKDKQAIRNIPSGKHKGIVVGSSTYSVIQ